MSTRTLYFPDNFLWGAATSAYQVEGNITNNWSEWEKNRSQQSNLNSSNFRCGVACDHFNRFREDIDLLASIGLNSYRFSIEWARVEPIEGQFDDSAITHYQKVLEYLAQKHITPVVTIWHWTYPVWLDKYGGLESTKLPYYLNRFTAKLAERLGHLNSLWITLNEPTVLTYNSFLIGRWPPQTRSLVSTICVLKNLVASHSQMYQTLKKICPQSSVGVVENIGCIEPYNRHSPIDLLASTCISYFWNYLLLDQVCQNTDFIGVNYYKHSRRHFFGEKNDNQQVSDMGWELFPEGIYHVVKAITARYKKPVYITEHGLADAEDNRRGRYIEESLNWLNKTINEGADVRGYFHWSLIDNYEWADGYAPRFGLVDIDREHGLNRTPRESSGVLKNYIIHNTN